MNPMNKTVGNGCFKRSQKQDWFFFVVFLVLSCFVFWKCRFGFGNIDESFYLTVPYRLLQGDALFQEEWHLSQMAGVLTMPVVSVFLALKGSTEGILLAMRYVCTFVQCAVSAFLYTRLRKVNWLGAFAAAISFLLYTPFGIMALSYNSMGILFLTVSQVILLTAQRIKNLQYVFAGLCFAAAVLCCPYLLVVYIGYLLAVAVRFMLCRRNGTDCRDSIWSVRSALCFTGGAVAAAILFGIFVLSRGSLDKIISAFSPMLNDPEHMPAPRFEKLITYFFSVFYANTGTPYMYPVLVGIWVLCILDRNRKKRKILYFGTVSGVMLALMISHFWPKPYINYLMWSVNLLPLFLLLLSDNSRMRSVFTTVCVPGLLYSYCLHLASNQRFYAISSASAVACVGSLVMLGLFCSEILIDEAVTSFGKKVFSCMLSAVILLQLGTQVIMRYESVFWDQGMQQMRMTITDGIEKGLITSEDMYYDYYASLDTLDLLAEYPGEQVLYLSENTWYYLQSEKKMAAYSAWLSGVNEKTLERLEIYYEINSHKLPDLVYVGRENEDVAEEFCRRFSYHLEQVSGGYVLRPL